LRSLGLSLIYRFMFLEDDPNGRGFSPTIFKATKLAELQVRASDMLDQLNLLLLLSEKYGLSEPKNIIRVLGVDTVNRDINDRFDEWDREKKALYQAARDTLKLNEVTYSDKEKLTEAIQIFRDHTEQLNKSYTAASLGELLKRLDAIRVDGKILDIRKKRDIHRTKQSNGRKTLTGNTSSKRKLVART
jgi:hypothetical protein